MKKHIVWQAVFLTTAILGINELKNGQIVHADEADSEAVSQNQAGNKLQEQSVPLQAQKVEVTNSGVAHELDQASGTDESANLSTQQVVSSTQSTESGVGATNTEQADSETKTESGTGATESASTNTDSEKLNSNGASNSETTEDTQQQNGSTGTVGNNTSSGDGAQQPVGNKTTDNTQRPETSIDGNEPVIDDHSHVNPPSTENEDSIQGTINTVGEQKFVTISDLSKPVPIYDDTNGNQADGTFLIPDSEWTVYSEYRDAAGVNWLQVGANQWIKDVFSEVADPKKNEDSISEDRLEFIVEEPVVPPLKGQKINAPANFTVTIGADSQNVWEYYQGEDREVVRKVAANSIVAVKFIATDAQGIVWYGLSSYEWITANVTESPYNVTFDNSSIVKAPSAMTYQISNNGNSLEVWSYYKTPYRQKVGKSLSDGTKWKVFKIATDNNFITWYNLGGDQWIPADPDLFTNPVKIPTLTVGQVATLPKSIIYTVLNNGNPQTVWDWFETSEREFVQKIGFASRWKVSRIALDQSSRIWFDLGVNQWVRANGSDLTDLETINFELEDIGSKHEAAPSDMIYKVTNSGQPVAIWNTYKSFRQQTGQSVLDGSSWKVYEIARDTNGLTWYNLGGKQWIPRSTALLNKKIEIPNPDELQIVTAPADLTYTIISTVPKTVYDYFTGSDTESVKQLSIGSSWKVTRVAKDEAGNLWFELGTYQWVPTTYYFNFTDNLQNHHGDPTLNTTYTINGDLPSVKIWTSYKSFRNDTGKTLAKGTKWKVYAVAHDQNAFTWYNLGGNQWISASPAYTEGNKSLTLPIATNTTLPAPSDLTYTVINKSTNQLWTNYNDTRRIGKSLAIGSNWKVFNVARDSKNQIWYDLGGGQWLNRDGMTWDDIGAIHFDEIFSNLNHVISDMTQIVNGMVQTVNQMNVILKQMIVTVQEMNSAIDEMIVGLDEENVAVGEIIEGLNESNAGLNEINIDLANLNHISSNLNLDLSSINGSVMDMDAFYSDMAKFGAAADKLNGMRYNLANTWKKHPKTLDYLTDNSAYFAKFDLKNVYFRYLDTNFKHMKLQQTLFGNSVSTSQWDGIRNYIHPIANAAQVALDLAKNATMLVRGSTVVVDSILGFSGEVTYATAITASGAAVIVAVPSVAVAATLAVTATAGAVAAYEGATGMIQYFNPNPTSRTFGQPIDATVSGRKVRLRVDAEIDSNKIQIQAGGGKSSNIDSRIDVDMITNKQSIGNLISKEIKRALSSGQLDKLVGYVWQAYKYLKG